MIREPARVWYLAMDDPAALRPAPAPDGALVVRAEVALGALNRFFYEEVGRGFHWVDREGWAPEEWQAWAERVETWLLLWRGTPAGYAELERRDGGSVEVAFFGLLEPFRGRGLGGHLLTQVVARAWALGTRPVTVNTCELDGPYARRHYEARGFALVREATEPRGRRATG